MAGAITHSNIAIIFRALVDILDLKGDRRAGSHLPPGVVGKYAGENAHLIGLLPLRGEARLAGTALVEKALNILSG